MNGMFWRLLCKKFLQGFQIARQIMRCFEVHWLNLVFKLFSDDSFFHCSEYWVKIWLWWSLSESMKNIKYKERSRTRKFSLVFIQQPKLNFQVKLISSSQGLVGKLFSFAFLWKLYSLLSFCKIFGFISFHVLRRNLNNSSVFLCINLRLSFYQTQECWKKNVNPVVKKGFSRF